MTTEAAHQQAARELIKDPGSAAKAKRVLDLSVQEPERAALARESIAPGPQPIALDIVREHYNRHNLHMPERPARVASPDTLAELLTTLQAAADAWQPIKAIGDGYGFANTGFTKGTLLPMVGNLDTILTVDTSVLRDGVNAGELLAFEAGATIGQLNAHLWQRKLALRNQPGFERLTFVGVMSSGGHGSGIWTGPLSAQVRSLHMVTVDKNRRVVQMRVEPTEGITNKAKHDAKYPKIELVQDDAIFNSCTCAMGCLGVIYAATIVVRPAFNIRETRRKLRWADVRAKLPQLLAEQGPGKRLHSIEVWVNPYQVEGEVHCVLGEREETTEAPHGHRGLGIEWGGVEALYRVLAWWMKNNPETMPALIDAALDATQSSNVVLHGPDGLNFGGPNHAPVVAASGGIPAAEIGAQADKLIGFFQEHRRVEGGSITSPIGLRFVKGARAHLSPSFGRDTCMIEVPILEGTPKARGTLRAYHDFIHQNFGGRPHWGQINDMPGARLEGLYPELPLFMESYRVLNPKGFFDNAFTEQMGFRLRH
jgi:hypothetical protein